TSPKATLAPGSPASFSTTIRSPGETRYCLPPVLITAYIVRAFKITVYVQNGMRPRVGPRARAADLYAWEPGCQRETGVIWTRPRRTPLFSKTCELIWA